MTKKIVPIIVPEMIQPQKKKWWQKSLGVIGGVGLVALGTVRGVGSVTSGNFDGIEGSIAMILGGLSAIGIRKKQQKNGEVQKALLAKAVEE